MVYELRCFGEDPEANSHRLSVRALSWNCTGMTIGVAYGRYKTPSITAKYCSMLACNRMSYKFNIGVPILGIVWKGGAPFRGC